MSHPNRVAFEGCLTLVDVESDKAPSGARGHRVILTHKAAKEALDTLLGMAVDYKAGWDGHDARQKVGVITSGWFDKNKLMVKGYLYSRDFPEIERFVADENDLGMSYELADAHVEDMREKVWTLTRVTFTGAAILLRAKAAYQSSSFKLTSQHKSKACRELLTTVAAVADDHVALCIWREARGEGIAGMTAVACVIRNRAARKKQTLSQVVMVPWAFSSMTDPDDPQLHLEPKPGDVAYAFATKTASAADAGTLTDITRGATLYYDDSIGFPKSWNRAAVVDCGKIGRLNLWREI